MNFDRLQIADWIKRQVEIENISDPGEATEIESHCLALARTCLPDHYRLPMRAQLFWRGITRGNRNATAAFDDPDFNARDFLLNIAESQYHPALREFLANNGVVLDAAFPATPEEAGFVLAGGSIEPQADEHWRLIQLYAGQHAFEGRGGVLDVADDGDHFTQSAGWVAATATNQFVDRGCLIKTLRGQRTPRPVWFRIATQ